jgi:hypothetical protein
MSTEKLIGTWQLVSAVSTASNGERDAEPYGPNPTGFLTYGSDGRVNAIISHGGRKPLSSKASTQEQAEAFKSFFAYAGHYTLKDDQVIHHIEISSVQNYVTQHLVRTVRFEGDEIVLTTPPTVVNGRIQQMELIWRRLPEIPA